MHKATYSKSQFTFATEHATILGLDAAVLLQFIEELWAAQSFTTPRPSETGTISASASTWLDWLPFFSPARFMVALETLEQNERLIVDQQGELVTVHTPHTIGLTQTANQSEERQEEDVAPPLRVSSPPPEPVNSEPTHSMPGQVNYDTSNPARLLNQTGDALWATAPSVEENTTATPSTPKANGQARKRCRMDTQWQPSGPCAEMVKARGIEWEFAMAQREGFVLYYMDSGQMSTSWDSKFLDWVNRRWQYHLNDRQNGTQTNTVSGPRAGDHTSERAPRERKQQLRQRLRDIGDLDW